MPCPYPYRNLLQSLTVVLLLCAAPLCAAQHQEQRYQVEMIIFTQDDHSTEYFGHPTITIPPKAIPWDTMPPELGYQNVEPTHFLLQDQAHRIAENKHYHIKLHTAWQQSFQKTHTIHLFGGQAYFSQDQLHQESQAEDTEKPTEVVAEPLWEINGFMTLRKHHFFQTHICLQRSQYGTETNNPVVMNQSRRLRSNQLNYFDHPKLGVLLLIQPIGKTDEHTP